MKESMMSNLLQQCMGRFNDAMSMHTNYCSDGKSIESETLLIRHSAGIRASH